ncbi:MAG: cyclic pyranopterin monophosphate synthase MoaC [Mycoplasmatales bacterium]
MNKFSHFDKIGNAHMIDISDKSKNKREAIASGEIICNKEILDHIKNDSIEKGDVLNVARIAGIMATKNTSNVIPMCHPLLLSHASINYELSEDRIKVICKVIVDQATGVEMEALNGVSTALLTIYDMCKAVDKSMVISNIHLDYKSGGKSGTYQR